MFSLRKYCHPFVLIALTLIFAGCSSIPSTDKAKENIRANLIPEYIQYVKADIKLTSYEKETLIKDAYSNDYEEICSSVVPRYEEYVKGDKNLSKSEKEAYLNEAKCYLLVKNRFK